VTQTHERIVATDSTNYTKQPFIGEIDVTGRIQLSASQDVPGDHPYHDDGKWAAQMDVAYRSIAGTQTGFGRYTNAFGPQVVETHDDFVLNRP